MGADVAALLQHHHGDFVAGLGRTLLEPDRGCKPRGPGADDHHVELHGLAFGHVVQSQCSTLSSVGPVERRSYEGYLCRRHFGASRIQCPGRKCKKWLPALAGMTM